MTESIVYNIPTTMVEAFRRNIVVRSIDPSEMLQKLTQNDLKRLAYLQILGTGGDIDSLMHWKHSVPVDLVVQQPESDLPLLYRYSPLIAERPVRVSVRVAAGFSKVVKLALSLNFTVKLEVTQPEPALIEELLQIANLYLHQTTVSQPVEFIHSIFWSFYNRNPVTLWAIQEEDPAHFRYITDLGVETLSRRLAGVESKYGVASFIREFTEELLIEKQECGDCAFFENCAGYFKWPRIEYRCDGVKALFQTLRAAAEELRADIVSFSTPGQENRP
ncbi:MAG: hypothetical protein WCR46_09340 [Deltaproteobacteria bacterium]